MQDLTKALEMSPANEKEVVAGKLQEAQQGAARQPPVSQTPHATNPQPPTQPTSTPPHVSQADWPSDRTSGAASSSGQADRVTVEDGHVSDGDSDTVEEIPQAQPQVARQQASMAGPPMGMPPGVDPEQMRRMTQDPAMMRQMADMMGSMDPAQLESMSRMAGAPGHPLNWLPSNSQSSKA